MTDKRLDRLGMLRLGDAMGRVSRDVNRRVIVVPKVAKQPRQKGRRR